MKFVKGITCLAFILYLVCACKKQPVESEYMLERDNKTGSQPQTIRSDKDSVKTATILHTNPDVIIYAQEGLPTLGFDSLYGVISCCRPENNKPFSTNSSCIRISDSPFRFYYGFYMFSQPQGFQTYNNPTQPELVVCEFYYKTKLYRVLSKIGFSNCILDTNINKFFAAYGQVPYEIKFDGPPKNTHQIKNCNGDLISITNGTINLSACGSASHYSKPNSFKVTYSNFENFEIDGKSFLIHKYAEIQHKCKW